MHADFGVTSEILLKNILSYFKHIINNHDLCIGSRVFVSGVRVMYVSKKPLNYRAGLTLDPSYNINQGANYFYDFNDPH